MACCSLCTSLPTPGSCLVSILAGGSRYHLRSSRASSLATRYSTWPISATVCACELADSACDKPRPVAVPLNSTQLHSTRNSNGPVRTSPSCTQCPTGNWSVTLTAGTPMPSALTGAGTRVPSAGPVPRLGRHWSAQCQPVPGRNGRNGRNGRPKRRV